MAVIDMIGRACGELTVIGRGDTSGVKWSDPEKHRAYARAYKARKAA